MQAYAFSVSACLPRQITVQLTMSLLPTVRFDQKEKIILLPSRQASRQTVWRAITATIALSALLLAFLTTHRDVRADDGGSAQASPTPALPSLAIPTTIL